MPKQIVSTENALAASGFVFTAGQIPLIPGTSDLREGR
jgi:enamine deaminase RidA (YjgF/YER057c/UK114 family)